VRIVIDARPAVDPRGTGVTRYTNALVRHLPLADPTTEYVAWYAKGRLRRQPVLDAGSAANLTERSSRVPARVFERLAARLDAPRVDWTAGPFRALLATNFLPPPTRSGSVVLVVHDLAFLRFPETAPQIDRRWVRRLGAALRSAHAVITPSRATRDDLLEAYDVDASSVHVVPHGVEEFAASPPAEVDALLRRLGIEPPFVLFVGGLERRKNLSSLIQAFALAGCDAQLVLAGPRVRWSPRDERDLRMTTAALPADARRCIVFPGYVDASERRALLSAATALASPSLYEGFGLSVLEAMAAGVPVLASNVSSLPEVTGDAALLVDPRDVEAIAEGLRAVLTDEHLRKRLARAGTSRARSFTWSACAERTAALLHAAAASSPSSASHSATASSQR
jgi:glycosyltransferase involved in cell wall biosynthesis